MYLRAEFGDGAGSNEHRRYAAGRTNNRQISIIYVVGDIINN